MITDRRQLNARARFVAESFLTPVRTLLHLDLMTFSNHSLLVRLNFLQCLGVQLLIVAYVRTAV
jgi:hypothetical protein